MRRLRPGFLLADNSDETGSKDRATVALVDAKVATALAKMDGLAELVKLEFSTIREDVKALGAIVGDVIKHGVDIADHERRLTKLETDSDTRPARVVAAMALLVAVAAIVVPLLAGAYNH